MSEAWRIFFHPRSAARELQSLRDKVCGMVQSLASAERAITGLTEELTVVRKKLEDERQRCAELEDAVSAQNRRLSDYEAEAAEWKAVESEMEVMYKQLEKVEELKHMYEKRIYHLRLRLRDRDKEQEDDSSELMDMSAEWATMSREAASEMIAAQGEEPVSEKADTFIEDADEGEDVEYRGDVKRDVSEEDEGSWLRDLPIF